MSTDANQFELLVREVLARLAQQVKAEEAAVITAAVPPASNDELELMASVISVQS